MDGWHEEQHTLTSSNGEQTLMFKVPYANIPSYVGTIHRNSWDGVAQGRLGYDATTTSLKYQGDASYIFSFFISGY